MKQLLTIAGTLALGATLALPAGASPLRFAGSAARVGSPHALGKAYGPTEYLKARGARYVGHASIASMSFDIATPLLNEPGLKAYARAANTPGSLYYRKWLNPSQLASAYGTPLSTYQATEKYFQRFGIAVKTWPTRNLLTLTGSSRQFEGALGTTFGRYQIKNRLKRSFTTFTAPDSAPAIAAMLPGFSIGKLVSVSLNHTHFMTTTPPIPISAGFANARVNGASPAQLARAFDYTGAYEAGFTGKGVNLGIIGTGPISPADVPNMRSIYKTPGTSTVTIVPATVNGDSTPPPATGPCTSGGTSTAPTAGCNPEDIEAQLDTEQQSLLAYDANVFFFLAYNASADEQGLDLADDELEQAVNSNSADILSLSYGGCEVLETALGALTPTPLGDATGTDPTLFAELAAEGIAVFVSSGDSGSAGCQEALGNSDAPNVEYPASDPNVVAVGGTTTPMAPSGLLTGPITTWGEQTESGGAEGAGLSIDFAKPSYQVGEPAVCLMRCVPDVVLDADPFSGAAVVFNTGLSGGAMEEPVGGTSQAAPDMAAMWALVLSACKVTPSCSGNYGSNVVDPTSPAVPAGTATSPSYRLGNPNFLWYKLGVATPSTTYHATFYDIVYGNDGVPPYALQVASGEAGGEGVPVSEYAAGVDPGDVSAGSGIDEATGLGAPFARALIKYIVGV